MSETLLLVRRGEGCDCELARTVDGSWLMRTYERDLCPHISSVKVLAPSRLLPEDEERVKCDVCNGVGRWHAVHPCKPCLGTGYRLRKRDPNKPLDS